MAQIGFDRPFKAKVQWWDSTQVYVHCPLCEEIHRHGFINYNLGQRRSSHCAQANKCDYEFQFPALGNRSSGGEVGYEIDKVRALFVAGGADPGPYFLRHDGEPFSIDLSGRRKWTEATELVPGWDGVKKIVFAVADVVNGDIPRVRRYLDHHSNEADILIHGVEAHETPTFPAGPDDSDNDSDNASGIDPGNDDAIWTSGKTALHLAACETSPEMVKFLLQRGADPNAQDREGRTPLVEAALWGRLESVETLLGHGARKEIECERDGLRLRAVDFARPLQANQKERHTRSTSASEQKSFERDLDRKAIVCLLQDEAEEQSQGAASLPGFAFTRSPTDDNLLTMVAHFNVPGKWKTIGVLYRGSQLPCVAAMSGWAHHNLPDVNIQIAGKTWTDEVFRLARAIGYSLPPRHRDQGEPGQFYACHAEKQLVAYFVHKHLFLPEEVIVEPDLFADTFNNLSLEGSRPGGHTREEGEHERKLLDLKRVEPPQTMKKAIIMVCRGVCPDCARFVEMTNEALGLDITVFHRCLDPTCGSCNR